MLRRISFPIFLTLAAVAAYFSLNTTAQSHSGLQRLTNTPEQSTSLNPSLSDSGSIVAFESTTDLAHTGRSNGFHALYTSGTNAHFNQIGSTRLVCPGLSSDGEVVVFASAEDLVNENTDRNSEIYLFHLSRLTQITHTIADSIETRLTDGNFHPQISGDGRYVVFSTTRTFASVGPGIALFDRANSQFTHVAPAIDATLSNPQISGDGTRVVFVSRNSMKNLSEIFGFNTQTHETRLLAEYSGRAQLALARTVSHDGEQIVFSAEHQPNQSQLFLFDERDTAIRQLTTLPSRSADVPLNATISGDGKRIAFATRRRVTNASDGSVELYVLDLPTGTFHQITNAPAQATAEVISSLNYDGSAVAFNFSRLLSGPVTDDDSANHSEIYLSAISARPAFGIGEAFNAAAEDSISSNTRTFGRGSLVHVKGNALAVQSKHAELIGGHFPMALAGVTATVNSRLAELVYVSPTEATVVLPSDLSDGPTELVITNRDGFQIRSPIVISAAAPGLFSFDAQQTAAILDADRLIANPLDPTDGNLRLSVFATGVLHANSISAELNDETVAIEHIVSSNVPGLDELHMLVPTSFRGAGRITLTVVADGMRSNDVTFTLNGSPVRDVLINEFLADPPDGLAGDANHDGTRSASADEFIELVNTTSRDLNLAGYKLLSRTGSASEVERHRFSASSIVPAGTAVVVFGGGNPDTSNPLFGGALVLKASSGSLSLSNGSGAIFLKNAVGEVVSSVTYGSQLGMPADINQSLTRFPDLTGPMTRSSSTSNGPFSPGARVDAMPFLANPRVMRVEVTASRTQVFLGDLVQLRAAAVDVNNSPLTDVLFSWQTNPANVVSVDSNGLLTALRSGSANVVATARGVSSNPLHFMVTEPTPTPTPTPIPSPSATPSQTPTPTPLPVVTPTPTPSPSPSPVAAPGVRITQIFGGGGNAGAPFRNDFIEIFNAGLTAADLTGWSVQYASATASTWSVTSLSNLVLASGQRYLIQEASGGTNGAPLPTADAVGTVALAATAGKVALVRTSLALSGACPSNPDIVDLVGYGSTATCFRGAGPAPAPSNTNSIQRGGNGCVDTQNNATDFVPAPPNPGNTSSPPLSCTQASIIVMLVHPIPFQIIAAGYGKTQTGRSGLAFLEALDFTNRCDSSPFSRPP